MDTKPKKISPKEWQEILTVKDIQDMWGVWIEGSDAITAKEFSEQVYGVKFNFVSGSPGYCGDVFILMGEAFDQPVTLFRDYSAGRLTVLFSENN